MSTIKIIADTTGYKAVAVDAPSLEGSNKQVEWAADIRQGTLLSLSKQVAAIAEQQGINYSVKDDDDTSMDANAELLTSQLNDQIGDAADNLFAITDAKWWIDNRADFATMLKKANNV